jgi:SAM-dependent methyltransferase
MDGRVEQSVNCALCKVDDTRRLVTKRGYHVVKCRRCDLVYVSPQPTAEDLRAIYNSSSYSSSQVEADEQRKYARRDRVRAALLARHQPRLGRLLDVGCSSGGFLRMARDRGFQVSGIDIGRGSVERARAAGLDAHVAVLEDAPFSPGSFDVISLFDSIEHMAHPLRALEAARVLLKNDGLLVVTTPNVDGLFPRLTWQLFGRTVGAWEHPGPPAHLFQFSRDTLRLTLRHTGFREVWGRTEAIPVPTAADALEGALIDVLQAKRAGLFPPRRSLRWFILRGSLRAASWAFSGALSPPAAWLDGGDSMLVLARKQ